jgi:beta-phosphoglucomutase
VQVIFLKNAAHLVLFLKKSAKIEEKEHIFMEEHQIATLIFDLDGTIVDTEKTAAEAVETTLKEWGVVISEQDTSYVVGRKFEVALQYLKSRYKFPSSEEETHRAILKSYRKALEQKLVVVPGVVEAVKGLAKHFSIGLVSGSGRAEILWILKKLDIDMHFGVILGAEDYRGSKPSPEGYLKAMNLMAVDPRNVLIFEDSEPGICSGRDAGAWVIAIEAANYYRQDQSFAHKRIQDFSGVNAEWVRSLKF